jgi:hypothetical protein
MRKLPGFCFDAACVKSAPRTNSVIPAKAGTHTPLAQWSTQKPQAPPLSMGPGFRRDDVVWRAHFSY